MHKFFFSNPLSIFASLFFSVIICSLPALSMFIYHADIIYKVISLIAWLTMILIMTYNSFARRIVLSQNGVKYLSLKKVYEMRWEEIKEIGIADFAPFNKGGNYPFIFFSTNTGNSLLIYKIKINQDFVLIRYRKKVIKVIQKYWNKEIINLNYYKKD